MNNTLFELLINIIVFIPVILVLIVFSLKLSKKSIDRFNSKSYIQILEKINISKESSIYVIKMGTEGCVLVNSNADTQILKELDKNEIEEIIKIKKEKHSSSELNKVNINNILNNKLIRKIDNGYNK